MKKPRIKKNDQVVVIAGRSRGALGSLPQGGGIAPGPGLGLGGSKEGLRQGHEGGDGIQVHGASECTRIPPPLTTPAP